MTAYGLIFTTGHNQQFQNPFDELTLYRGVVCEGVEDTAARVLRTLQLS